MTLSDGKIDDPLSCDEANSEKDQVTDVSKYEQLFRVPCVRVCSSTLFYLLELVILDIDSALDFTREVVCFLEQVSHLDFQPL